MVLRAGIITPCLPDKPLRERVFRRGLRPGEVEGERLPTPVAQPQDDHSVAVELTSGGRFRARSGVMATGVAYRRLDVDSVDEILESHGIVDSVSGLRAPWLAVVLYVLFALLCAAWSRVALYAVINVQWAPKALYPQPTAYLQQDPDYLELMEALLKAGADPNVRTKMELWYTVVGTGNLGVDFGGATPFWRAAYGTDVEAMKLLVDEEAGVFLGDGLHAIREFLKRLVIAGEGRRPLFGGVETGTLSVEGRPERDASEAPPVNWFDASPEYFEALGIPVVYYISPQLWAWRAGRMSMGRWFLSTAS